MYPHQQYGDRIVAFVDVLGFKDLVMQSQSDNKVLKNITSALSSLYGWIWQWEADCGNSSFAFTQFSDSVVLSAIADTQDSFDMLLQLMLGIVDIAYNNGVIVRLAPHEAAGQAFNIAYGGREYLIDIYYTLTKALENNIEPKFGPDRKGDIKHSNADISKARKFLGYDLEYDFARA